jgi:hypothetical protein
MRTIVAFVLLMVCTTQAATLARAKCGYSPLPERLDRAEIVFTGRLVGMARILVDRDLVDDYRGEGQDSSGFLGEFRVEKVWRGSVGSTISVLTDLVGCGRPFGAVGKSYVVLANRAGSYVVAHAGCQGVPQAEERAALALLGAPKKEYPPDATENLAPRSDGDPHSWSSPSLVGAGFLAGTAVASLIVAWTARRRPRR